jgi:hypothetical protein
VVFAGLNLQGSATSINVLGVTTAAFCMRVFGYGGDLAVLAIFLQVVVGEF